MSQKITSWNCRDIATDIGAVLIFDEVSSGWRLNVGGAHKLYGVHPDFAVFGKAMSNGYPMAAIIGKEVIMDIAQSTFISSTYWTDRMGPVAAIATINKMLDNDAPSHLCRIGNLIRDGWERLGKEHNLNIDVEGISPMPHFAFDYKENQALQTLFTQEMLDRGYLASESVYVSYSHNEEHVEKYLENVNDVFSIIEKAIVENNIHAMLKGPIKHEGFKRLT